jgi:hypothetical protein
LTIVTGALFLAPYCLGQAHANIGAQEPKASSPAFSIAVDGPTSPIRLGSPIKVNVTVTNTTGKNIFWEWDRGKDATYKAFTFLLVRGGREAETTVFHRKMSGRQRHDDPPEAATLSPMPVSYPPGKMFTVLIDINRIYDIKESGAYTLKIGSFDQRSNATVQSNSLTLKIAP